MERAWATVGAHTRCRKYHTVTDIYSFFHLHQGVPLLARCFSVSFPHATADPHRHPFLFFFQRKYYRRSGQDTLCTSVPQLDDELAGSLRVLTELETCLPAIRTQAGQVRVMV
jgi:hypothetical protein